MDSVGVFLNEDWDSLSKIFSSDEEADFALQSLQDFGTNPSNLFDENLFYSYENFNTNFYISQQNTNYCTSASNYSACFPSPSQENHHFCDSDIFPVMNDVSVSMNFCVMDEQNNALAQPTENVLQDALCLNEEMGNDTWENADNTDLGLKKKFEEPQQPETVQDLKTKSESVENPKKKSRVIRDTPKNKRNAQPKKKQKLIENVNNDEESSSSCGSEDGSNASQDLNGGEPCKSSEKARSGRGAATDPQSLYARRRRERINERLKILQNLVPNGTKVDISTMLEEAVHYVKFLQTQIKLLSSDDMWMYAPIAYNGMDMGLYQKISSTL